MRVSILASLLAVCAALGCAGLSVEDVTRLLGGSGVLDEATVARGLRQALSVGTERAARSLAQPGGFADDPRLRLGLPEQVEPLASTLRRLGLSGQVDELESAMNRAAEAAAGEAVPVFAAAIGAMTIDDAMSILRGPEDAATRYFEAKTSASLRARFEPVVTRSMQEVGLYGLYADLKARYDALPFVKPVAPELESWVTDRTLAGLFSVLAEEEARIRRDPAARTTTLLRRVFGSQPG